jgi:hypothetical protein
MARKLVGADQVASQFETNFVKKQDDVLTLFVILLAQYDPDPAFAWETA